MKIFKILLLAAVGILASCKNESTKKAIKDVEKEEVSYLYFGDSITDNDVISRKEMAAKLQFIPHKKII